MKEFTKEEWWYICKKIRPDWTFEHFEKLWEQFLTTKARRLLH